MIMMKRTFPGTCHPNKVDIEMDIESAEFKSVLDELEKSTDYLGVLGSY